MATSFDDAVKKALESQEIIEGMAAAGLDAPQMREYVRHRRDELLRAVDAQDQEIKEISERASDMFRRALTRARWLRPYADSDEIGAWGCGTAIAGVSVLYLGAWIGVGWMTGLGGVQRFMGAAGLGLLVGVAVKAVSALGSRRVDRALMEFGQPALYKQRGQLQSVADEALKQAIIELARGYLSEALGVSGNYALDLPRRLRFEGFSERLDSRQLISTETRTHLLEQIQQMPCGSIGVAGPRGAGKTTLLRSVSAALAERAAPDEPSRVLTVFTSVPVEYQGRDFILHLYANLCREVLRNLKEDVEGIPAFDRGVERPLAELMQQVQTAGVERTWQMLRPFGVGLTLAGLALFLLVGLSVSVPAGSTQSSTQAVSRPAAPSPTASTVLTSMVKPDAALPWALVTFCVGLALVFEAERRGSRWHTLVAAVQGQRHEVSWVVRAVAPFAVVFSRRLRHIRDAYRRVAQDDRLQARRALALIALNALTEIRYQRSYTAGWSGAFKMPVALEMGSTAASTLAEAQRSLPDIVDSYRNFVGTVLGQYDKLVIAIDELDKLESQETVFRFLNEVKALFGIDGCYYLISVSDAAISDFERRNLDFSNAFDSALDTMVRASFFTPAECRAAINKRVIGLPQSFLCAMQALSGGLPRDLIRVGRDVAAAVDQLTSGNPSSPPALPDIVRHMVHQEVLAKLFAIRTAVRPLSVEPYTSDILTRIQDVEFALSKAPGLTSARLCDTAAEIGTTLRALSQPNVQDRPGGVERLQARLRELAAFLYYTATVLELFVISPTSASLRAWDDDPLPTLVRARQELRVHPAIAFAIVSSVRKQLALTTLDGWSAAV